MQAAWYEKVGPAAEVLQVGELPDPEPQAGEVRVRIHATGVNPSDVKNRAGQRGELQVPKQIPGSDGAGIVDSVGGGVDRFRPGDRVWVHNAAFGRAFGTSAQYICLPENLVVPLPEGLDFAQGACLGIPVMTAHRSIFADGPVTGQRILICGGAGVVGCYAIQLAKWGGAQVITTISSEAKAAHAARAGADHCINYRQQSVADEVLRLTDGRGVDRIVEVEGGTNLESSIAALKQEHGVVVVYGSSTGRIEMPFLGTVVRNPLLRPILVYTMPAEAKRSAHQGIEDWVRAGHADFAIAERVGLDNVVQAHECVEQGVKLGHVVVDIA